MTTLTIYRKRYIPNDITALKDDIILLWEKDLIITKWQTLRPRKDIASGISAYFIDKGFKISKIFDKDNQVVYWYCDIIQAKIDHNKNTVLFEDLLIDVILYKDGSFRIADLDELSMALEHSLISLEQTVYALRTLDSLLSIIYSGDFSMLQKPINEIESLL